MCSVSLKNKISSVDFNGRLGLEEVADIVRRGRLRWFGHLDLNILNEKAEMTGCPLAEALRWQGQTAGTGIKRHGMSVSGSGALLEGIVQPVPAWKNGR